MLQRILDTSAIDMNNPHIQTELEIDLRNMERLFEKLSIEDINAYKVKVYIEDVTCNGFLYNFDFEIQYGVLKDNIFNPVKEPIRARSESLMFPEFLYNNS